MGARLYYPPKQQDWATLAVAEANTDGLPSPNGSNWLGTSRPSRVDIPSNGEIVCFGICLKQTSSSFEGMPQLWTTSPSTLAHVSGCHGPQPWYIGAMAVPMPDTL